jgi:hypothetical protein
LVTAYDLTLSFFRTTKHHVKLHSAPTWEEFQHRYSEAATVFPGGRDVCEVVGGVRCLGAREVDWRGWEEAREHPETPSIGYHNE